MFHVEHPLHNTAGIARCGHSAVESSAIEFLPIQAASGRIRRSGRFQEKGRHGYPKCIYRSFGPAHAG